MSARSESEEEEEEEKKKKKKRKKEEKKKNVSFKHTADYYCERFNRIQT
jgi:hypothetical protein